MPGTRRARGLRPAMFDRQLRCTATSFTLQSHVWAGGRWSSRAKFSVSERSVLESNCWSLALPLCQQKAWWILHTPILCPPRSKSQATGACCTKLCSEIRLVCSWVMHFDSWIEQYSLCKHMLWCKWMISVSEVFQMGYGAIIRILMHSPHGREPGEQAAYKLSCSQM